jgi:hypothetical protein
VDQAFYDLIQWLLDEGHQPWRIRGLTGTREWLRTRALMLCCRVASTVADDHWDKAATTYRFEHRDSIGLLKVVYEDNPTRRRAARPSCQLRPAGRPAW